MADFSRSQAGSSSSARSGPLCSRPSTPSARPQDATSAPSPWKSSDAGGRAREGPSRGTWAAAASVVAALLVVVGRPLAAAAQEVDVFFGVGNFFHLQHEIVLKEALDLGRREGDITTVAGYAGGTKAGELERVCYSGFIGAPDHVKLGHAQVVRITLPEQKVLDFTRAFLDEVPKRKDFESGPQFRPAIGLRGGFNAGVFPRIAEAADGRAQLVKGEGDDSDTDVRLDMPKVYVYDTKAFPFRFAELQNQFRNNPPEQFTNDYRELNDRLKRVGSISSNGCP